ncbi:murein hydrolase activator EnvC family protein [Microbacterium azadirachtae]|uniref:Peptidase family M23 n=1 Tax=Microbacterium azadirachtae TaxID=582680 RepID=A0A0F0LFI4_9MICO|nr:M23 family metallopeptidase [Microbacterium azadirachtae]KJL31893.1 Peptidase family M23 [Microbacterium azadirachtae]
MPRSPDHPAAPVLTRRPALITVSVAVALLGGLVPVLLTAAAPVAIATPAAATSGAAVAATDRAAVAAGVPRGLDGAVDPGPLPDGDWLWPVVGARTVVVPFRAPAHAYGPGHRGMDVAASGEVRAPASGAVAFHGVVVDRALLTIDHGNGLVTTLEPVQSDLGAGAAVRRGDAVATVSAGGHTAEGALHIGVRWNGAYINPMLLFGGVPRAVLLPCGPGGC